MELDIILPLLYIIGMTSAKTGINFHVGFTESNRLVEDCKPLLVSHPRAEKRAGTICVKKSGTAETVVFVSFTIFDVVERGVFLFYDIFSRRYIEYEELHKVQRRLLSAANESS